MPLSLSASRRGVLTAVLAVSGLALHLTVQRLAPAAILHAGDAIVGLTPFLPWTVWIYLLFFPFLVAAGALQPAERWPCLIGAWALASVVTWVLVLLVPVTFARPDLATLDPVHRWALGRVYGVDAAHVTFPCLHSALTWISWWALRDRGPRIRAVITALAVAIPLSTMTTRQHLVTDNVAALVIAWVCVRTALPARSARPTPAGVSPTARKAPDSP